MRQAGLLHYFGRFAVVYSQQNIGALIRIGFGGYYTKTIIRTRQNPILIITAPTLVIVIFPTIHFCRIDTTVG